MHDQSLRLMRQFAGTLPSSELRILDVGSRRVSRDQKTYRRYFGNPLWEYIGADIEAGLNVDVVLDEPYRWQFASASFDVVISGQCLEHVPEPWLWVVEVARVLMVGGLTCLIAPAEWPEHKNPVDCYRYLPDGMKALAKWANLTVIDVGMKAASPGRVDTWLIATK